MVGGLAMSQISYVPRGHVPTQKGQVSETGTSQGRRQVFDVSLPSPFFENSRKRTRILGTLRNFWGRICTSRGR